MCLREASNSGGNTHAAAVNSVCGVVSGTPPNYEIDSECQTASVAWKETKTRKEYGNSRGGTSCSALLSSKQENDNSIEADRSRDDQILRHAPLCNNAVHSLERISIQAPVLEVDVDDDVSCPASTPFAPLSHTTNASANTSSSMNSLKMHSQVIDDLSSVGGYTYEGGMQNGQRQGWGRLTFKDEPNTVHEGNWEADVLHGKGSATFPDGCTYSGDWCHGHRCGQGVLRWPNGDVYSGEWNDDRMHGKGIYRYANGDVYDGEWEDDRRSGYGCVVYALPGGSDLYQGYWKNDLVHGKGKYTFNSGSIFEGDWSGGRMNGSGSYKYQNGNKYTGDVYNNLKEGHGELVYTDQSVYTGQWHLDQPHGYGKYISSNDCTYEGTFYKGKLHGKGTYRYSNGNAYTGDWHLDMKHGFGTITFSNMNKYVGIWVRDKPHGSGQFIMSDGRQFSGVWDKGRLHGAGTHDFGNGNRFTGVFRKGRKYFGRHDTRGVISYEGGWKYDKPHGKGKIWIGIQDGSEQCVTNCEYDAQAEKGLIRTVTSNPEQANKEDSQFMVSIVPSDDRVWVFNSVTGDIQSRSLTRTCSDRQSSKRRSCALTSVSSMSETDRTEMGATIRMDLFTSAAEEATDNVVTDKWFERTKMGTRGIRVVPADPDVDSHCIVTDASNDDSESAVSVCEQLKEGYGTLNLPDGGSYLGFWKAYRPHGIGRYISSRGDSYEGEWAFGRFHGRGLYRFADGTTYEGEVASNRRCGSGILKSIDGVTYDGQWLDDWPHGMGIYADLNTGVHYSGQWHRGRFHGTGGLEHRSWGSYQGSWENSRKNGHGRAEYANGCIYQGSWKDDVAHGQGLYVWPDGAYYDGAWLSGRMHGLGVYVYAEGGRYEGCWKDNLRNGNGLLTFSDGAVYKGMWKEDVAHGHGTLIMPDKLVVSGIYEDGHLEEMKTTTQYSAFVDGSRYELETAIREHVASNTDEARTAGGGKSTLVTEVTTDGETVCPGSCCCHAFTFSGRHEHCCHCIPIIGCCCNTVVSHGTSTVSAGHQHVTHHHHYYTDTEGPHAYEHGEVTEEANIPAPPVSVINAISAGLRETVVVPGSANVDQNTQMAESTVLANMPSTDQQPQKGELVLGNHTDPTRSSSNPSALGIEQGSVLHSPSSSVLSDAITLSELSAPYDQEYSIQLSLLQNKIYESYEIATGSASIEVDSVCLPQLSKESSAYASLPVVGSIRTPSQHSVTSEDQLAVVPPNKAQYHLSHELTARTDSSEVEIISHDADPEVCSVQSLLQRSISIKTPSQHSLPSKKPSTQSEASKTASSYLEQASEASSLYSSLRRSVSIRTPSQCSMSSNKPSTPPESSKTASSCLEQASEAPCVYSSMREFISISAPSQHSMPSKEESAIISDVSEHSSSHRQCTMIFLDEIDDNRSEQSLEEGSAYYSLGRSNSIRTPSQHSLFSKEEVATTSPDASQQHSSQQLSARRSSSETDSICSEEEPEVCSAYCSLERSMSIRTPSQHSTSKQEHIATISLDLSEQSSSHEPSRRTSSSGIPTPCTKQVLEAPDAYSSLQRRNSMKMPFQHLESSKERLVEVSPNVSQQHSSDEQLDRTVSSTVYSSCNKEALKRDGLHGSSWQSTSKTPSSHSISSKIGNCSESESTMLMMLASLPRHSIILASSNTSNSSLYGVDGGMIETIESIPVVPRVDGNITSSREMSMRKTSKHELMQDVYELDSQSLSTPGCSEMPRYTSCTRQSSIPSPASTNKKVQVYPTVSCAGTSSAKSDLVRLSNPAAGSCRTEKLGDSYWDDFTAHARRVESALSLELDYPPSPVCPETYNLDSGQQSEKLVPEEVISRSSTVQLSETMIATSLHVSYDGMISAREIPSIGFASGNRNGDPASERAPSLRSVTSDRHSSSMDKGSSVLLEVQASSSNTSRGSSVASSALVANECDGASLSMYVGGLRTPKETVAKQNDGFLCGVNNSDSMSFLSLKSDTGPSLTVAERTPGISFYSTAEDFDSFSLEVAEAASVCSVSSMEDGAHAVASLPKSAIHGMDQRKNSRKDGKHSCENCGRKSKSVHHRSIQTKQFAEQQDGYTETTQTPEMMSHRSHMTNSTTDYLPTRTANSSGEEVVAQLYSAGQNQNDWQGMEDHDRTLPPRVYRTYDTIRLPPVQRNMVEVPTEQEVTFPVVEERIITKEQPVNTVIERLVPEYNNVCVHQEVERFVPIPVEHVTYMNMKVPQVRLHYRPIEMPFFAPRFLEVPVPEDFLDDATQQKTRSLRTQLEAFRKEPYLSPNAFEDLADLMTEFVASVHLPSACPEYLELFRDVYAVKRNYERNRLRVRYPGHEVFQ